MGYLYPAAAIYNDSLFHCYGSTVINPLIHDITLATGVYLSNQPVSTLTINDGDTCNSVRQLMVAQDTSVIKMQLTLLLYVGLIKYYLSAG